MLVELRVDKLAAQLAYEKDEQLVVLTADVMAEQMVGEMAYWTAERKVDDLVVSWVVLWVAYWVG